MTSSFPKVIEASIFVRWMIVVIGGGDHDDDERFIVNLDIFLINNVTFSGSAFFSFFQVRMMQQNERQAASWE